MITERLNIEWKIPKTVTEIGGLKKKKGNWEYSRNKREILEIKNKITEMKNTTENFKSKISEKAEENWKQNIK